MTKNYKEAKDASGENETSSANLLKDPLKIQMELRS